MSLTSANATASLRLWPTSAHWTPMMSASSTQFCREASSKTAKPRASVSLIGTINFLFRQQASAKVIIYTHFRKFFSENSFLINDLSRCTNVYAISPKISFCQQLYTRSHHFRIGVDARRDPTHPACFRALSTYPPPTAHAPFLAVPPTHQPTALFTI